MIVVDSSVWIDHFNGVATRETEILDTLLGVEPIVTVWNTRVFSGFQIFVSNIVSHYRTGIECERFASVERRSDSGRMDSISLFETNLPVYLFLG